MGRAQRNIMSRSPCSFVGAEFCSQPACTARGRIGYNCADEPADPHLQRVRHHLGAALSGFRGGGAGAAGRLRPRARGSRRRPEACRSGRQRAATRRWSRIADLARIQAETAGRLQALGEGLGGRQAELARVVAERLDAVSTRIGHSMDETTRQTVAAAAKPQRAHRRASTTPRRTSPSCPAR